MAVTIVQDSLRDVSATEVGGLIRELHQECIVTWEAADQFPTNLTATENILSAAEAAGVGVPGSKLGTAQGGLYVTSRGVRIESTNRAQLTVSYRYINDSLNNAVVIRPSNRLKQITTQTDRTRTPLRVVHNEQPQNGEISVLEADHAFQVDVRVDLEGTGADGNRVVNDWINKTNSSKWDHFNGSKWTWLCTMVNYQYLNWPNVYMFTFEFAYDVTTWQPQVFWRESSSGRPPLGLAYDPEGKDPNAGRKDIKWYDERDYNADVA